VDFPLRQSAGGGALDFHRDKRGKTIPRGNELFTTAIDKCVKGSDSVPHPLESF